MRDLIRVIRELEPLTFTLELLSLIGFVGSIYILYILLWAITG